MTTFILKKYNPEITDKTPEKKPEEISKADSSAVPNTVETGTANSTEVTVTITGTISEIVANALYKALPRNVAITETEEATDASLKAISTEEINAHPLEALNAVNNNDVVFISNTGFNTTKEEWFLTNVANKTNKVIYTVEGLIGYVKRELKLS